MYKPTKQTLCFEEKLHGIVWSCLFLDNSEFPNSLSIDVQETKAVKLSFFLVKYIEK